MKQRRFGNTDLTTSPIGFGTWERLAELAAAHGRTLAQLAIAWVLDHAPVTVALVGMRNARELGENVGAAGWKLSDEIRAEVDRIFAAEHVPTYAGTPVTVRPDQRILSEEMTE